MTATNDHDIHTLNGLIEITLDSADGYREAAKETESGQFKTLFEQRSFERQKVAGDLQETVRRAYTSVRQGHDQMRDIKHAMEGKSDGGVIPN